MKSNKLGFKYFVCWVCEKRIKKWYYLKSKDSKEEADVVCKQCLTKATPKKYGRR